MPTSNANAGESPIVPFAPVQSHPVLPIFTLKPVSATFSDVRVPSSTAQAPVKLPWRSSHGKNVVASPDHIGLPCGSAA